MINSKNYVCITGASSGIGLESAKAFAKLGNNLILVARRQHRLEKLKKEILSCFPQIDVVIESTDLSLAENAFKLYQKLKAYPIITWINNAGFGNYDSVYHQDLDKIRQMIHLNIETLTILSSLYVKDYKNTEGAQLINLSSRGGYMIVPNAVTYCASKFYVSAFTEGLALELKANHCPLKAKVLAPAATKSEFGQIATDSPAYNYDDHFTTYHTSKEMADFLIELYQSDQTVGLVDVSNFEFKLSDPLFNH
ncbi:SDR family NAD(P)-dependent oxidoreductase [Streptococcus macacae]|uniref:KR domain protein n=1 Tax=Streptococcus macacae NCTC 11558 TaxID=764298 RepID=G5JX21_9STRE|nr:SDR family NAD(P)-dependent oxidoreductase [Streptococcus macacae]EHJ52406.1 KR domain protein [Streptococcus macacae NCTC 11558]SUN79500.1 short-chain dehydrogenase [Streptococcus macacae NCTC 11558]